MMAAIKLKYSDLIAHEHQYDIEGESVIYYSFPMQDVP